MKQWIFGILVLTMVLSLTACDKGGNAKPADVTGAAQSEEGRSEESMTPQSQSRPSSGDGIDVDLTELSSTMIYSEVYNMLVKPEDYIGKTVKMQGQFAIYEDPESGKTYYAVIIADATACCQQGLEFVLQGDPVYPEDYPEPGTEITVVGEFQTYEENEYVYCHLVDAAMDF